MEILYDLKEGAHQNRVDNEMQQIADGLTLGLKHYAESGIEVDMEVLKKLK